MAFEHGNYDVIVIGAGHAGRSRDLLLLEWVQTHSCSH